MDSKSWQENLFFEPLPNKWYLKMDLVATKSNGMSENGWFSLVQNHYARSVLMWSIPKKSSCTSKWNYCRIQQRKFHHLPDEKAMKGNNWIPALYRLFIEYYSYKPWENYSIMASHAIAFVFLRLHRSYVSWPIWMMFHFPFGVKFKCPYWHACLVGYYDFLVLSQKETIL